MQLPIIQHTRETGLPYIMWILHICHKAKADASIPQNYSKSVSPLYQTQPSFCEVTQTSFCVIRGELISLRAAQGHRGTTSFNSTTRNLAKGQSATEHQLHSWTVLQQSLRAPSPSAFRLSACSQASHTSADWVQTKESLQENSSGLAEVTRLGSVLKPLLRWLQETA